MKSVSFSSSYDKKKTLVRSPTSAINSFLLEYMIPLFLSL